MSYKLLTFSLLGLFLVGFILFSGCVAPGAEGDNLGTSKSALSSSSGCTSNAPNCGGPSEVDNTVQVNSKAPDDVKVEGPKTLEQTGQEHVESAFNNPNATPQQLLEALGVAQLLGLANTEKYDAEAKEKIKQWAEGIINDPNSTNIMLAEALKVLQLLGFDVDEKYSKIVWEKIKNRLVEEVNDPNTCKNRLLEIAEFSSHLGYTEMYNKAMKAAESAGNKCSKIIYEYKSQAEGTYYYQKYEVIGGTMKRYSVLGQTLGTRTYYFEDATFDWTYKEVVDTGCVILTREGKDKRQMKSPYQSLTGFDANSDHYSGGASIQVEINIDKQPSPTRNEYCNELPDQQLGQSKEFENLQIHIDGNAKGHRLIGQKTQNWGPPDDQETGFEYTYWDVSIGE